MHASVKYRNFIDLKQSLHITAAFEYYVRTILPEMHSQEAITFYNEMSTWVDKFIEENSGDLKRRAKKFKKKLSPYMSLSEKLQKVIDGYPGWEPIKPALKDWFGNVSPSRKNGQEKCEKSRMKQTGANESKVKRQKLHTAAFQNRRAISIQSKSEDELCCRKLQYKQRYRSVPPAWSGSGADEPAHISDS